MFIDKKTFGGQIYHILENKVMDKFFLILRERMGPKCVPMSEILRRRVECHRDGRVMVMGYIADQVPFWNNIHYWTDFLNHDTPVLTGAETITKRFNDRAIYLDISRPRRGYYHIDLQLLADESKNIPDWEITEAFTRALEKSIQRAPQYWLWTHNRWKRTREEWLKMVDPKTGKVLMR
jgi:KDO2-lipid IV(A) lauroyltransferase